MSAGPSSSLHFLVALLGFQLLELQTYGMMKIIPLLFHQENS
jgi:hypothetical protein